MVSKIKRSEVKTFLNTGTVGVPVWSLISQGVPDATINMNPKTTEETYIADDNASITVDSYAPTMAISARAFNGDAVFEWIDAARKGRSVLEDAETEIVNVWLYETAALGIYYAEKIAVSVACDSFGGPGGEAVSISYTINMVGDPVLGGFDPTGLEFTALAVNTTLTTLSIESGTVTLTPLFATDKTWLWYAGSVANGVTEVQMDSTLAGATIVQADDGGTPVAQGDPASLGVGDNDLTVDVTVGTENVIYTIRITRAAS